MASGLLGFYITCDDAVCLDCIELDSAGNVVGWEGFEDWTEPIAIWAALETDVPFHCSKCDVLIPVTLTADGGAFVADAILYALEKGEVNPTVVRWAQAYGDDCDVRAALIEATTPDYLLERFYFLPETS